MLIEHIGQSLMRNTWVEINLDRLRHNLLQSKKYIKAGTKIAGVIKANAYGHGSLVIAKALIKNGVDMLAVANISEAIEIRRECPKIPILIMGHTPDNKLRIAVENNITTTIFSLKQGQLLSEIALSLKKRALIHIKINTGFNRIGLNIDSHIIDIIRNIYNLKNIEIEGIFTHFALKSAEKDKEQFDLFMYVINELESKGIHIPIKHTCDSIAMTKYPDYHLDMIRLGSFMYGVQTSKVEDGILKLIMSFKTQISHINEIVKGQGIAYGYTFVAKENTLVATLPVGYGDGYMRCLGNVGQVSIKGQKVPLIGRVCMDQCTINISGLPQVKIGDQVLLLGETSEDIITLNELADYANTNKNEILSTIARRVPRVYIENNEVVQVIDYLLD